MQDHLQAFIDYAQDARKYEAIGRHIEKVAQDDSLTAGKTYAPFVYYIRLLYVMYKNGINLFNAKYRKSPRNEVGQGSHTKAVIQELAEHGYLRHSQDATGQHFVWLPHKEAATSLIDEPYYFVKEGDNYLTGTRRLTLNGKRYEMHITVHVHPLDEPSSTKAE